MKVIEIPQRTHSLQALEEAWEVHEQLVGSDWSGFIVSDDALSSPRTGTILLLFLDQYKFKSYSVYFRKVSHAAHHCTCKEDCLKETIPLPGVIRTWD